MNKAIKVNINLKLILFGAFVVFVLAILITDRCGLIDTQTNILSDAFIAFGETTVGRWLYDTAFYILYGRDAADAFLANLGERLK